MVVIMPRHNNNHFSLRVHTESKCQTLKVHWLNQWFTDLKIILDNAKYQKCALVASLALELNIELLYLPAYSPNLNLIERFWKFVKKNCLNSIYYKDFNVFSASICDLVDNAHTTHYEELSSLLSWNFQLYSEDQIKNAA